MSVVVAEPKHTYYLVFSNSKRPILKWLKDGYQHCAIVRNEYGTIWTVIQDAYNHLSVTTALVADYPDPMMLFESASTIIPVDIDTKDRFRGHICLFNCVEVCKAVLGIKKPFILTPYQLYRYFYERDRESWQRCAENGEETGRRDTKTETEDDAGKSRS